MKQFKKIGLLLAAFMLGIFSVWAQKPIKTLVVTGRWESFLSGLRNLSRRWS